MSANPQEPEADDALAASPAVVRQALRRDVNDRMTRGDSRFDLAEPAQTEVMCECSDGDCSGRVVLTVSEYELVRRFPNRFLVKEGHAVADDERVVAEAASYIVVEKTGRAGLYAVAADPRRRSERKEPA